MEEIDLKELYDYFKSKLPILVIIIFGFCLLGSIYSLIFQKPLYSSYTTIVLSTNENSQTITQNDVNLNKNLVDTYAEIIKSRRVLDKVIDNLGLDISYNTLYKKINVTSVNNTEIIKVIVSDEDTNLARDIASETADVFILEVGKLFNINNANVLDKAIVSDKPYNINVMKQAIIYIFVGMIIGLGILFIYFYFDRTIKSSQQIEEKFKLPILGNVREYSKLSNKYELIINTKPKSNISEDIRTVRTNLQFTLADKNNKSLLITSSIPSEGKTFLTCNLGAAFAQNGEKVLLVDTDLRLGMLHKAFNVSNEKGLSNLILNNDVSNCSDYIKSTNVENLYVITRGTVPPNPSELLNSDCMKKLVKVLKNNFDYVIFDGVPINGLSDSLVMATYPDKVVLIASCDYTKIDDLENSSKSLEKIDANIAGVVVNKVKTSKKNKYYSYYE